SGNAPCATGERTSAQWSRRLLLQPQSIESHFVRRVVAVHHAEAVAIVAATEIPHVPADTVMLKRCAHIMQPARPVLGIRIPAVHAKLVAGERHVPVFRPLGSLP